ncbi:hypothetical protein QVD17_30718 [Tagetes erecta]|uniref:Uncharacterized protein n=1 Tax=Tagetes erecta TaxID=13708 RepID=A0AAD8K2D2_TARER|nr:hypothetical protein QVD17_30718 [Tagetes erecta]
MVANNLKKHDPKLGNHEQVQRLLDSLPPEWSSHGKLMRRERGFPDYKLVEVMNKLKEMELDIKRRLPKPEIENVQGEIKQTSVGKDGAELNDKACDAEKEEEQKTNTRVCNCEKALASEKIIMELPYETVNKELKLNESKYFVKLREALKENEHLKTNLLKTNVEVNMLTERVALAEFETTLTVTLLHQLHTRPMS